MRLLLLCGLALAARAGSAAPATLVAPEERVGGMTQEDWSRAWWQWAGSFDDDDSPVGDPTGRHCGLKQDGPVWFLAGTWGTKRTVRTCSIPRDRHLFFPLVNAVFMPPAGQPGTCLTVMTRAAEATASPSALLLEIDGVRHDALERHRVANSQCFDLGERAEPPLRVYPAAGSGYYVMLRPLPPGRHTLHFGGALPGLAQGVTYTLIVE